jgi:hypothetical protein
MAKKQKRAISVDELTVTMTGVETVLRNAAKGLTQVNEYQNYQLFEDRVRSHLRLARVATKMGQKALDRHLSQFNVAKATISNPLPLKKNSSLEDEETCIECGAELYEDDGYCDNCDAPSDEEE